MRSVYVVGNEKETESVDNVFFFFHPFSYERLRIYIHTLQYQCNLSLNCNEQYKGEIGRDSNTLRESNHNKIRAQY